MDPRVTRTRAAITAALFELIQERRWDRISVQDILNRTGMSRSTFYAHYDNKLDVLTSGAPQVMLQLIDPVTGRADLHGLFAHVDEMADVLGPLLSQPVLGDITASLERNLAEGLNGSLDLARAPHAAGFIAGALVSSMRHFVLDRRRPPAHRVARELERYIDAILDTITGSDTGLSASRPDGAAETRKSRRPAKIL